MTVTDPEIRAVLSLLQPLDKHSSIVNTTSRPDVTPKVVMYLGRYANVPVAVASSSQGPVDASNVVSTMKNAITDAKYVIAVGICYGMYPEKTKLGDVIVVEKIIDFKNANQTADGQTPRHDGHDAVIATNLQQLFQRPIGFQPLEVEKGDPHKVDVHYKPIISKPDLIKDEEVRDKLKKCYPKAYGGEMEGSGIMITANNVGVSGIVIKAIADWGDGDKEKYRPWQPFAAYAAASYVHHQLKSNPSMFD